MEELDFTTQIVQVYNALDEMMDKKKKFVDAKGVRHDWSDNEYVASLYELLYRIVHQQIYDILLPIGTKDSEAQLRNIIAKYVIGYKDKNKVVWKGVLTPLKDKITQLARSTKKIPKDIIMRFYNLYDDFMAIAAFRSLEHFCLYLENDYPKKLWRDTLHLYHGLWYYANRMILDHEVQFIEKRFPTAYGKSLSDVFMIAYKFGQDINARNVKIFGNKYNIVPCFDSIAALMSTKRYAKVFPYFTQFNCNPDLIFEINKKTEGEFKIRGSSIAPNLRILSKKSDIDGIRADLLFIDDITQSRDLWNVKMHEEDIRLCETSWLKRTPDVRKFGVIAGGTSYSNYDLLSHLANKFGFENAEASKLNKFTKVARSNMLVKNGLSVFVTVPKLDENDKSTYEKAFPTEKALKDRDDNFEIFMAMEQQEPLAPKENPFYHSNLLEYETLPKIGENGRTDCHWASIDPKRGGKDNLSMPILAPIGDKHYLIDFVYDSRPMKDLYGIIVAKIIQHHVTKLFIENNTDTSLKTLLEKMLFEKGYTSCVIEEKYNTVQKSRRISDAEGDIKSNIVFPKFGTYAKSSQMGKALHDVYTFSYNKANEHDDSLDALASYSERFIAKRCTAPTVRVLSRF